MHWHAIATAQDGIVSRAQLMAHDLLDSDVQHLVRRGLLRRVAQGVYLVGGAPMTYRARLWSAVLSTGGVLAFDTAAELWGISERPDEVIHVLLPHARRVFASPGIRLHRRRRGAEVHVLLGDLPVTARQETVLDQLGALDRVHAQMLADRALQRGWLRPEAVAARLAEFPGRPGNSQLRRIAARLDDGAASMAERRLHRLLRSNGVRGWKPNYQVWRAGTLIAVLDVALPSHKVAIEMDGMAYHVDADRFQRDRTRQNALVDLGWTVLRFTWADVTERPGYVVATVRRIINAGSISTTSA